MSFPGPLTLPDLFCQGRSTDDNAVFLRIPEGRCLSYREAAASSAQVADLLFTHGVRPGDRIVLQVEKSPSALLIYLACVRAGMVLVPLNPGYTDEETANLIADAEPAAVICEPDRLSATRRMVGGKDQGTGVTVLAIHGTGPGSLGELVGDQVDEQEVELSGRSEPVEWQLTGRGGLPGPRPDDLAAILYTSGTTGRPKGAMLTQQNLATNGWALAKRWGFRPDDVLLHALPLFHTHGLFVAVNCALASGASMVFLPRYDPEVVVEELPRCTVYMGVPTHYTRLLGEPRLDAPACRRIRLFTCGSAPLLEGTHADFFARTGHRIVERYGTTETSILTSNLPGGELSGTVGRALPEVTVRVTNGTTTEVLAPGEVGEVEALGPNVFSGYRGRPEDTTAAFTVDGWFRTGDLGFLSDGGDLTLIGRSKDLVISGGMNVYPKEVEGVLDSLDGVIESAVIGIPDEDLGEMVVAVVVGEPRTVLDEASLRISARSRLAGFKVPKRIEVVDALPRNVMGKVEKVKLRARFALQHPTTPGPSSATRSAE